MRPNVVAAAKRLRRASPRTGERRSLRKIGEELQSLGFVNANGTAYAPKSVRAMLVQRTPAFRTART